MVTKYKTPFAVVKNACFRRFSASFAGFGTSASYAHCMYIIRRVIPGTELKNEKLHGEVLPAGHRGQTLAAGVNNLFLPAPAAPTADSPAPSNIVYRAAYGVKPYHRRKYGTRA